MALVASSSSQCAEWSKGRVAEPVSCAENVLKKRKIMCFRKRLKFKRKTEKCGVARAVEPIRAELSTNLSECEGARALEPIHSESSAHTELKDASDRDQNKHKGRPKGIRETKPRPSLKRLESASYVTEPQP